MIQIKLFVTRIEVWTYALFICFFITYDFYTEVCYCPWSHPRTQNCSPGQGYTTSPLLWRLVLSLIFYQIFVINIPFFVPFLERNWTEMYLQDNAIDLDVNNDRLYSIVKIFRSRFTARFPKLFLSGDPSASRIDC